MDGLPSSPPFHTRFLWIFAWHCGGVCACVGFWCAACVWSQAHEQAAQRGTRREEERCRGKAMETSLRYGTGEKQLLLHAKENFLLDSSFYLQVHGKLNTHTGEAHGVAQLKRKFYPELLTSLDVGAKFDSQFREFTYDIQGKKTLPVTDNGLLSVDLKGGYNFNPGSKQGKPRGVVELSYKVFNFTEDQDLKLKLGYNVVKQKPYFQIRENNWTLNGEVNGGWSIIYDL